MIKMRTQHQSPLLFVLLQSTTQALQFTTPIEFPITKKKFSSVNRH